MRRSALPANMRDRRPNRLARGAAHGAGAGARALAAHHLEPRRTRAGTSRAAVQSRPAAALPASVDVQWPAAAATQVRVALGSLLRGEVTLDADAERLKVSRAAVWFGGGEPPVQRCGRR